MIGDAVGGVGVGGGGEIDGAAGGVLLFKILKEFTVVGQVSDVELDGGGEVALKCGFSLEQPGGQFQKGCRVVASNGERGVVQCVGLDEGAVEVDAEHWQSGSVDCGGRERQKCPFLRLTRILGTKCAVLRNSQHGSREMKGVGN